MQNVHILETPVSENYLLGGRSEMLYVGFVYHRACQ